MTEDARRGRPQHWARRTFPDRRTWFVERAWPLLRYAANAGPAGNGQKKLAVPGGYFTDCGVWEDRDRLQPCHEHRPIAGQIGVVGGPGSSEASSRKIPGSWRYGGRDERS